MISFYMTLVDNPADRDKFEELYYKYRKLMKYIAQDILKDEYLAEDAVHNAFIKILANLEKFKEADCQQSKNLVVIITRSVAIDMYRKRKKEFENSEHIEKELPQETDFSSLGAEELLKIIENMPPKYSEVLLLKIHYGYKTREIADLLNLKTATVSKRIERAREYILAKRR